MPNCNDDSNLRCVTLKGAAFYNLVRSAIEVFPRETDGRLFGTRVRGIDLIVKNAYPLQTSDRKYSHVSTGNQAAIMRLNGLDSSLNMNGSRTTFLGGYHSHPSVIGTELSEEDIETITGDMAQSQIGSWLEIVIRIQKRDYNERRKDFRIRHFARKLGSLFLDPNLGAYTFLMAAYAVDARGRVEELKILRNDNITKRQDI